MIGLCLDGTFTALCLILSTGTKKAAEKFIDDELSASESSDKEDIPPVKTDQQRKRAVQESLVVDEVMLLLFWGSLPSQFWDGCIRN